MSCCLRNHRTFLIFDLLQLFNSLIGAKKLGLPSLLSLRQHIVLVSFAARLGMGLHLQLGPEDLAFHPQLGWLPGEQAGGWSPGLQRPSARWGRTSSHQSCAPPCCLFPRRRSQDGLYPRKGGGGESVRS